MDYQQGDIVYEAFVAFGVTGATSHLSQVEVVLPEHSIVRPGFGPARPVLYGATLHDTMQEAREAAAARIRQHAAALMRQADDLAEPRVVTV
jgi:hypothetical protein